MSVSRDLGGLGMLCLLSRDKDVAAPTGPMFQDHVPIDQRTCPRAEHAPARARAMPEQLCRTGSAPPGSDTCTGATPPRPESVPKRLRKERTIRIVSRRTDVQSPTRSYSTRVHTPRSGPVDAGTKRHKNTPGFST